MYSLESLSKRYAQLLPTDSGPQYFVDIMKYLSTAVKTMCENEESGFKVRPDWREKPFFQVRLGPTRPSMHHREAPSSKSGASRSSKTNAKAKGPGYTVSYFGEEFHERIVPPTDSLRKTARYVLGLGVERDLHPEHGAFIELIAHGLYHDFSGANGDFMDLRSIESKLSASDYVSKGMIELLGAQLGQLDLTSASKEWATGDWPTEITLRLPPLDHAVFRSDRPGADAERKIMEVFFDLDEGTGMTRRSSSWPSSSLPSSSIENPRGPPTK